MPRRNHNADMTNKYKPNWSKFNNQAFRGPVFSLIDRPENGRRAVIKTTPESIVRDFRNAERIRLWDEAGSQMDRPRRVKYYIIKKFIRNFKWPFIFEYGCWTAVIACLIYFTIIAFIPFVAMLWE